MPICICNFKINDKIDKWLAKNVCKQYIDKIIKHLERLERKILTRLIYGDIHISMRFSSFAALPFTVIWSKEQTPQRKKLYKIANNQIKHFKFN